LTARNSPSCPGAIPVVIIMGTKQNNNSGAAAHLRSQLRREIASCLLTSFNSAGLRKLNSVIRGAASLLHGSTPYYRHHHHHYRRDAPLCSHFALANDAKKIQRMRSVASESIATTLPFRQQLDINQHTGTIDISRRPVNPSSRMRKRQRMCSILEMNRHATRPFISASHALAAPRICECRQQG